MSVIKFVGEAEAGAESWGGDLSRQLRDTEPDRPAVRCGDSMRPWT